MNVARTLLLTLAVVAMALPALAENVELAADGKALLPIVVPGDAPEGLRDSAETLAAYLQRITQAKFTITDEDDGRGIFVGTSSELPAESEGRFVPRDTTRREEYILRSDGRGL